MDEFRLKNFSKFLENFKVKRQQEFKSSVEDEVNEVVERLNLPKIKEKLDSAKLKGKELGIFKELSDEEVEIALEKDSAKAKIIENIKKINFKGLNDAKTPELVEDEIIAESAQEADICGAGGKKTHNFNSVSFTAGLAYLASLSTKATPKAPTIEQPVNWGSFNPDEPSVQYAKQYSLQRGTTTTPNTVTLKSSTDNSTLAITSEPQLLTLTNPFTGQNYKYTITLADQASTTSTTATFSFLANGRLVVTGNYVKIQAWDLNTGDQAQIDDLIIVGSYNEIYTGDGNDTVRVGTVIGSNYRITQETGGVKIPNYSVYTSTKNKVYTGNGDDYVTMYGINYEIDTGAGNDKALMNGVYTSTTSQVYFDNYVKNHGTITNCELVHTQHGKETYAQSDNEDGWFRQIDVGDCVMLSFINSLTRGENNYDFSQIMTVTKTSSGYNVTFKNLPDNAGHNKSISVTDSDMSKNHAGYGDFDSLLFITAFEKILLREYKETWLDDYSGYYYRGLKNGKKDQPYYIPVRTMIYGGPFTYINNDGEEVTVTISARGEYDSSIDDTWEWLSYIGNHKASIVSLWLFGESKSATLSKYATTKTVDGQTVNTTAAERKAEFKQKFLNLWTHYEKGEIKMMEIAPYKDNKSIGLATSHAYALKYVDTVNEYVVLINPWDDNDVVRLSYNDFFNMYSSIQIKVCGNNATELKAFAKTPAAS